MTRREAAELVTRFFARYPASSASVDELVIAEWAEAIHSKFYHLDARDVRAMLVYYAETNPSRYSPSLDELLSWIQDNTKEKRTNRPALFSPEHESESLKHRSPKAIAKAKAWVHLITRILNREVSPPYEDYYPSDEDIELFMKDAKRHYERELKAGKPLDIF